MFIEIEDLKTESIHIQHDFPEEEIKFSHPDAVLIRPVTTNFTLFLKEGNLRAAGTMSTAIQFNCSRCAKLAVRELDTGFDLAYHSQPEWTEDNAEIELKYEDMDVGFYDGIAFDVNLMILEQIELSLPMKFVCNEDCKGLCFECGTDLNEGTCSCSREKVDPRMGTLLEFRKKMDT
ncbi:MAG: DUF177 domain-containing protein [Acidobacteriota bacterium]